MYQQLPMQPPCSFVSDIPGSDDAPLTTFFSLPERPNGHGVVLAMSIWGVNSDLRSWADFLAGLGYAVVAPNLFSRSDPRHASEYEFGAIDEIMDLLLQEDDERSLRDLHRAADALRAIAELRSIALVGWCYGGRLASIAATTQNFDAAVAYYPTQLETRLDIVGELATPLLIHLPELEEFGTIPDSTERIVAAFKRDRLAEIHVYPGAHHGFAFAAPHPNQDAAAARLADTRSVLFLERSLSAA